MLNKKRIMHNISLALLAAALSTAIIGCDDDDVATIADDNTADTLLAVDDSGNSVIDNNALENSLDQLATGEISPQEEAGLLFMREEEKLARDVYLTLYDTWNQQIFKNISDSEQTHTDAILSLLQKYEIPDPVGNNAIGVFVNQDLQALNDSLVNTGNASLIDALQVGAAIEEIDIIDIEKREEDVINNDDIISVYEMLLKGSRNHLRAFIKNLENQGITYQPQYLSQAEYDAIINAEMERGN